LCFQEDISNPEISIEIRDMHNNAMAHVSNEDDEFKLQGKAGQRYNVTVALNNVYFTPTSYVISLWIGILDEVFDYARESITFDLLQGARVRRKGQYPQHVKCFLPSKWKACND
jgi:hypothetical protein